MNEYALHILLVVTVLKYVEYETDKNIKGDIGVKFPIKKNTTQTSSRMELFHMKL